MKSAEETALDVLAVAEGGLTQAALIEVLTAAGVRFADTRKPTGRQIQAFAEATPGVLLIASRYVLEEPEPRFRWLYEAGRLAEIYDRIEAVEPFTVRWGYVSCGWQVLQRMLRRALLEADDESLREALKYAGPSLFNDLSRWFLEPAHPAMLDGLSDLGASLVFNRLIDQAAHFDEPLGELQLYLTSHTPQSEPRRALHARLHLLVGEVDRSRALLEQLPSASVPLTRGLLALLDGDVKASSKHYAAHMSAMRKQQGNGYLPHQPEALYLPVAYLLHGTKSRKKQALTLIDRAWKEGWTEHGRMFAGWVHIAALLDPKRKVYPTEHPVGFVLEALSALWRAETIDAGILQDTAEHLRHLGLVLFAQALEAGLDGPIARIRDVRAGWKDTLAALEQALSSDAKPAAAARLAWTLQVYDDTTPHLEARLQKAGKKGWTQGRKVALSRLQGQPDPDLPLTEADRKLAAALSLHAYRTYRGYREEQISWDPLLTWRALVDHPSILDLDGTPLRIVSRSPTLRMVERNGRVRIELDPVMDPDAVRLERVGNAYEVTQLSPEQRAAAELIGRGLSFPAEAKSVVRDLLDRTTQVFRADTPEATIRPGSPVVHAFLAPQGTAVSVELGVLPAGPGSPRQVPGAGPGIVLGPKSEGHVRISRDLNLERAHLAQALSLPGLEDAEPGHPTLLELEGTLDFIAAARDQEIPVLWPEGGEIQVRRSSGGFGLQVRSAREWFETSGSLELEDGEKVALVELARSYLSSGQRFVRLDDGSYLALESKLRRGLDALVRLGDPVGEAIRLHPLATSALSALLELDGVKATKPARKRIETALSEAPPVDTPRGLKTELRPYQADGFQWLCSLAHLGAGAILADDMGLGKTISALALLLTRRSDGPALVIAPTSVGGNWVQECARFAPGLTVHRLRQIDAETLDALGPADLLVCSYGLLVHRIELLAGRSWTTVVFDESQALKNPKTQRHQAALRIQAGFRLALTGTPIENHLGELHAQMSVVLPGLLGSASRFSKHFARPIESGDRDARRSLKALVSPFLLRRTKSAVLHDLPPRTELQISVELSPDETRLYEAQRLEALESLEAGSGAMEVLGRLSQLRQLACSPALIMPEYTAESSKTKAFRRLVKDLNEAGHRALVFSQFVKHLTLLRAVLDDEGLGYAYLDGSTPAAKRDTLVSEFQTGDLPFFLISLKAGGTGLNLTAADYVLHMDPWWNPAVEDQASDRAHRIGQKRAVTVYRVVAKGTIEEQIVALHTQKRDLADQILEGSETVSRLSADDLLALLQNAAP